MSIKAYKLFYFLIFFFASNAIAKPLKCSDIGLRQKDCILKSDSYKIHIWKNRIFINNKIFRTHYEFPLFGPKVEWSQVNFIKKNKDIFFETYIWGVPDKNTRIQNLYWTLYKVDGVDISKSQDLIIQKRVVKEKSFLFEKKSKNKFIFKNGKPKWQLDYKKGDFKFKKLLPIAIKDSLNKKKQEN